MRSSLVRSAAFALVLFGLGFVAGQVMLSRDVKARAEARRVTLIEGTLKFDGGLRQIEQLKELGYVDGTVDPRAEIRGVEIHDRERTFPGVNFYSSRIRNSARLIDNNGRELHGWSHPGGDGWEHAELLPNGDLIVVVNDQSIFRIDKDSKLLWRHEAAYHHGLTVDSSGDIFALSNEKVSRPEIHPDLLVVEDFVVVLSADGEPKSRFSILEAMRRSEFDYLLASPRDLPSDRSDGERVCLDLLHTNHLQVFDGSLAHRSPLYRAGNILISMRTINTIAILDPRSQEVLWVWGPTNLHHQHHPTLIENGNIIVFDNGRARSQIIEVDPLSFDIAWRYAPAQGFLSRYRGSVQRLPNGNTLITESDRGYVFEVTPEKEIVWRFANPDIDQSDLRIAIWRMTRFSPHELDFLAEPGGLE